MNGIIFAIVQLWNSKALVLWRGSDYTDAPPYEQLDTAFQVVPLERDEGIVMASALYQQFGGKPEEMYLSSRSSVPHEAAPNYPEEFQRFLQVRAGAKESGRWERSNLPSFRADRLDYWDRYIELVDQAAS